MSYCRTASPTCRDLSRHLCLSSGSSPAPSPLDDCLAAGRAFPWGLLRESLLSRGMWPAAGSSDPLTTHPQLLKGTGGSARTAPQQRPSTRAQTGCKQSTFVAPRTANTALDALWAFIYFCSKFSFAWLRGDIDQEMPLASTGRR